MKKRKKESENVSRHCCRRRCRHLTSKKERKKEEKNNTMSSEYDIVGFFFFTILFRKEREGEREKKKLSLISLTNIEENGERKNEGKLVIDSSLPLAFFFLSSFVLFFTSRWRYICVCTHSSTCRVVFAHSSNE